MIYLYSGTPGSGKSLHQARNVWNRLAAGKPVIANYDVNTSLIKPISKRRGVGQFVCVDNYELTPDFLRDFSREYFACHKFHEGEILLFIDEAQIVFNCRDDNMSVKRKDWVTFFTQHRKFGYDIFFVAQFDRMLDRQIRSLIEYEVIHRKVSNFGVKGWILSLLAGGNLFVSVKMWYPMKERIGSEFFRYRRRYSRLYDSYKDFTGKPARKIKQNESKTVKTQEPQQIAGSCAS